MGRKGRAVARNPYRTLLIVGEGDSEVAFLSYLKAIYAPRGSGVRITLRNAHGKGPDHVIEYAVRQSRQFAYDTIAVLLDTDLPWPSKVIATARTQRLVLIPSEPCLDGLLLRLLGRPVPELSNDCKEILCQLLPAKPTDPDSYKTLFQRALLDERCGSVVSLATLRALMQGRTHKA